MADTLFDTTTELETVRGSIARLMYSENGRIVAKVIIDSASRIDREGKKRSPTMSVLGSMIEPLLHQVYEFSGIITWNSQYCSHEMKFESYRTILPDDKQGIYSYLVDTAQWVGPSHAKALLEAFGDKTLEVLKNEPDKVIALNLAGLTGERVREMADSLSKNEKLEAATIECNNLLSGILGPGTVRKAIRLWACDAGTIIRSNPFELTRLHGVGFISADAVHKKLDRDPLDMQRHRACVVHILSEAASRDGHTILPKIRVDMEGQKLVGGLRSDVYDDCEKDGTVGSDGITVSLAELSKSEKYVANKIISMLAMKTQYTPAIACNECGGTGEWEPDFVTDSKTHYDCYRCDGKGILISPGTFLFPAIDKAGLAADQAAAVDALCLARLFALVGAPGTGKTYTVARIVKSLQAAGLVVQLAAPTGKAAKQMMIALAATCGGSAMTIHSLLGAGADEDGNFAFSRGENDQLECDVLVIDETSMVDIRLAKFLLKAVRDTTRVLFVGDPYQLPSVGPGALLRDLLRAGVPAFELKEIKRNAGDIVRACHAIKDGKSPRQFASQRLNLDAGHNWRHIDASGPGEIKEVIDKLVSTVLPKWGSEGEKLSMFWDVQIVSPTNEKGELSCDSLNKLVKGILNPTPPEGKLPFGLGDKVLRTKNATVKGEIITMPSPDDDCADDAVGEQGGVQDDGTGPGKVRVVNGDIGTVKRIDNREVEVEFRYPHRLAHLKRSEHEMKLAYCMTCHKLQGSECNVVVLPVHQSFSRMPMVTREWIYTAMSRAKIMLITIGDLDAIDAMVPKIGMHARQTTLARMLERSIGGTPPAASMPVLAAVDAGRWDDL